MLEKLDQLPHHARSDFAEIGDLSACDQFARSPLGVIRRRIDAGKRIAAAGSVLHGKEHVRSANHIGGQRIIGFVRTGNHAGLYRRGELPRAPHI